MDSSRRAVESYWRSRMIDAATSNEDKVTPVYKLQEICELLRSSHVSIVKEVSEFILKRLDNKSPIVKQKALRLIKYAVGKSGVEFQREMQRHSVAVRQLIHYRGQPDPLKGDALNKAVRDSAQEALSAMFSEQDQKPIPVGTLNKRMEGFGNTNFALPSEDKKSFLSEVVGIGSASIMQGISSLTQGHSFKKNDNGSYRGPNLHRSLTMQNDSSDRYEPVSIPSETQGNFGSSNNVGSGVWNSKAITSNEGTSNGDASSSHAGSKTREERLLETIVTSGGVRLQPTRDALQGFLVEAAKLDALALTRALESKLQSPQWQVRMKAVCVLDSIVRKKDDEHFSIIASYFCENQNLLIRCSESPQASLRDKTNKVLSLLGGAAHTENAVGNLNSTKTETANVVQMPDLIDTGDPDDSYGTDAPRKEEGDRNMGNSTAQAAPLIDDLFGDGMGSSVSTSNANGEDDPFADVSFHHRNEDRGQADDIFAGMTLDNNGKLGENKNTTELLPDIFGSNSSLGLGMENVKNDVNNLMASLSIAQNDLNSEQKSIAQANLSEDVFSNMERHSSQQVKDDPLSKIIGSQGVSTSANMMFPPATVPSPGMAFGAAFPSHPINYAAMGNLLAQQQFLATMSNLQFMGSLSPQNGGMNQAAGNVGGYSSALPDIFQPNFQTQVPNSMTNMKKEETKAFDFISDHLAAARDPKRIL